MPSRRVSISVARKNRVPGLGAAVLRRGALVGIRVGHCGHPSGQRAIPRVASLDDNAEARHMYH